MRDRLDRWADPPLLVLASLAGEAKHGYATAAGARQLAEQSERMRQVSSVAQRRLRASYGWAGA